MPGEIRIPDQHDRNLPGVLREEIHRLQGLLTEARACYPASTLTGESTLADEVAEYVLGTLQPGLTACDFTPRACELLDEICRRSGYCWWIDLTGELQFTRFDRYCICGQWLRSPSGRAAPPAPAG